MRVCLMVEGQEGVTWEQWLALARACEEHGLEALFRSDHYLSVFGYRGRGSLDAWTTLAALAAVTRRIRLGTLVSPVTFRHPSVLAKAAVTVDHISGGRVEVGLGAGWHEEEHRAYGFDFPVAATRMALLAEQLEVVHRQWSEERLTFEGEHYRVRDLRGLPRPLQRPHPPLIVGGRGGPRSVRLAARWADEYNTHSAGLEQCRRLARRLAEAWEGAGRDPATARLSLMTGCVVGADRAEVEARARRAMAVTGAAGDPEDVIRAKGAWLVGTPERVVGRLRDLEEAGVGRVMLQHFAHDDLEMVALVGREVVPAVA